MFLLELIILGCGNSLMKILSDVRGYDLVCGDLTRTTGTAGDTIDDNDDNCFCPLPADLESDPDALSSS